MANAVLPTLTPGPSRNGAPLRKRPKAKPSGRTGRLAVRRTVLPGCSFPAGTVGESTWWCRADQTGPAEQTRKFLGLGTIASCSPPDDIGFVLSSLKNTVSSTVVVVV